MVLLLVPNLKSIKEDREKFGKGSMEITPETTQKDFKRKIGDVMTYLAESLKDFNKLHNQQKTTTSISSTNHLWTL